jgi:hypothetical protein
MVLDVSVMVLMKAAMDVARSGVKEVGSGVGTASVGAFAVGASVELGLSPAVAGVSLLLLL